MRVRKGKPQRPRRSPTLLERINPNAAGIDCGAAEHYVAVRYPYRDIHAQLARLASPTLAVVDPLDRWPPPARGRGGTG